ncbi:ALF repeat-containing protein [Streptomyces sp. ASQP_92]|uniref:ALF repeat-containing protein n=1 Tax=Streptomyces sp. ASQP_92 TaxID=2979116 RepID=UPI0021C1F898|nr:ALF repeat-containing protein [Streptomyces sp. ASQP_92]MCT9093852.1 ALF repeat-containing protein [Streptomyces sp. ASQP_92]
MRSTRAVLLVAAATLAPALAMATPASAASSAADTRAAASAVPATRTGSASQDDDRVAVFRILYQAQQHGDRAVIREAGKALDADTPAALRAFITTGYRLAQAEDDRVAISRILATPGISAALRAACNKALDGTPEDMRHFLESRQFALAG